MTDDTDTSKDPDGFIVLHHNLAGGLYGVGPFPPDDDLATALLAKSQCDCRKEIVWIAFPAGIRMLVGVDVAEIIAAIGEIEEEPDQPSSDRLN